MSRTLVRPARRVALRRAVVALITGAATVTALLAPASAPATAAPAGPAAPQAPTGSVAASPQAAGSPVLGTARGQLYKPDGTVDVTATVDRLAAHHINTFAFLVNGNTEWNAFPALLTAAAAKGINIWAYLRPPSESSCSYSVPAGSRTPCYPPYQWNYKGWAQGVADLAASHPNLTGILMDDFGGNTVEAKLGYPFAFSQGYVADMMAAARATAPNLKLFTVMYYSDFGERATLYKEEVDGYVFPYMDHPNQNTQQTANAELQSRTVASMTKCGTGTGCLQLIYPSNQISAVGAYGGVSQTISVTSATSHVLTFSAASANFPGQPNGYQFLQVLIDGQVVWERDVTAGSGWRTHSVDVSARLAGKSSATLTMRMYHKVAVNNYFAAGWFDGVSGTNMTITNGGFEDATMAAWPHAENRAEFSESRGRTQQMVLMPYASRLRDDGVGYVTKQSYVRTITQLGLTLVNEGLADGVMPWNVNLYYQMTPPHDPNALGNTGTAEVVSQLFDRTGGGCLALGYPSGAPSTAGWYAGYSQTVNVTSPSTASITLWLRRSSADLAGYHRFQVLVNGTPVADRDLTTFVNGDWIRQTISLSSVVTTAGNATLTLRLFEGAGVNSYGTTLLLDDIRGTGLTVANGTIDSVALTGWSYSSQGNNWVHQWRSAATCA